MSVPLFGDAPDRKDATAAQGDGQDERRGVLGGLRERGDRFTIENFLLSTRPATVRFAVASSRSLARSVCPRVILQLDSSTGPRHFLSSPAGSERSAASCTKRHREAPLYFHDKPSVWR